MGHASAKAAVSSSPKTGTVSARSSVSSSEKKAAMYKKLSTQSNNDIKAKIMGNLLVLEEAHTSYKEEYFRQNLPFYTCTDALNNTWKKEFPDGSIQFVQQSYDEEKGLIEKPL